MKHRALHCIVRSSGTRPACADSGRPRQHAAGSAILSSDAWARIASSLGLSTREVQIVKALFDDEKESAIAATLGISSHTVHSHVERLHHKLNVHDRLQIVLRVVREFLSLQSTKLYSLTSFSPGCSAVRCRPEAAVTDRDCGLPLGSRSSTGSPPADASTRWPDPARSPAHNHLGAGRRSEL